MKQATMRDATPQGTLALANTLLGLSFAFCMLGKQLRRTDTFTRRIGGSA